MGHFQSTCDQPHPKSHDDESQGKPPRFPHKKGKSTPANKHSRPAQASGHQQKAQTAVQRKNEKQNNSEDEVSTEDESE